MLARVKGFSLFEVLIAMAILAVMVVFAFPRLAGNSDKLAKQEAHRLVAAIELVRDRAIILNQEYGLNIDEEGYQFLILDETDDTKPPEWKLIEDIPELRSYEFPEGLEINLTIDGENAFSTAEDEIEIFEKEVEIFTDEEEQEKVEPPQIYFLSTGEQNQFSIGLAVESSELNDQDEPRFFRIQGFLTGNLKYRGPLEGNLFQDLDREYPEDELE